MSKKAGIDIVFENLIDSSTGEKLVLTVSDNFDFESIDREKSFHAAKEFDRVYCVNLEDSFYNPSTKIN